MRYRLLICVFVFLCCDGAALADSTEKLVTKSALVKKVKQDFKGHVMGAEFKVTHFADKSMIDNPLALTFDEKNRMYVAEIGRFHRGVEDTRRHNYWFLDEIKIKTLDDRLKMYDKWIAQGKFQKGWFSKYADRIVRLEDKDGDGKADEKKMYASFNDRLDGNGSSVYYHEGKVYYTNIPNLWSLEDRDDDGVAEHKEVLQKGFGLRLGVNGHDMHGLEMGPDGRMYWSNGDRGYNFVSKEGKVFKDLNGGAIFRCEPDGSNIEIFCSGNRNPQDLAFDQYGNLFSVDNNQGRGDRSRLCYFMEGGEIGWMSGYENLTTFRSASGHGREETQG